MFCISCGRATPDGAQFCPGCGKQFQRDRPLTTTCLSCRASNPDDALFCWNCARLLREENRADFLLPIPSPPLPAGGQPPVGNVPMVQGTPQAGGVPMVQGTPQAGGVPNAPLSGQGPSGGAWSSESLHAPQQRPESAATHHQQAPHYEHAPQGAASSAAKARSSEAAQAPGQAGAQGVAAAMGQAASLSALPSAPAAPSSAPNVAPPAGQHPNPTPSRTKPPTQAEPKTVPSHSPMAAQHVIAGGIKVAGHLSRRAVLSLLGGGAVAVAAGTGAILYLNRSQSGGATPVQIVTTYNEALNRKDAQTAWDQLSTHYQSQYGSKEAFFRSVAQNSAIYNYKLSLAQENSSTATVVETEALSGCPGMQIAYLLVKENGVWKIDALRVANPCPQ